jgi:hypothetical protein
MDKCKLRILFDKADRTYAPGENVTGAVEVSTDAEVACKALTLTREWHTRGKGNTVKGETATITLFQGRWRPGETAKYDFSIDIPHRPLTYHGQILNIDWRLKARAHIPWAVDAKVEENFIVVPGRVMPNQGPQWKLSLGRWPEQNQPDQSFWGGVLTVVPFFLGVILGWQSVVVFFGLFIGFGIAQRRIERMLVQRRLGMAEVTIEPRTVAAGETAKLHVSFEPRVVADLRKITASFVGRERVISGDSESNETHTQVLYEETAVIDSERRLMPGQRIDLHHQLQVPAGAPPTFEASDNNLEWIVIIQVHMPWPHWKVEYPITVVPSRGPG